MTSLTTIVFSTLDQRADPSHGALDTDVRELGLRLVNPCHTPTAMQYFLGQVHHVTRGHLSLIDRHFSNFLLNRCLGSTRWA